MGRFLVLHVTNENIFACVELTPKVESHLRDVRYEFSLCARTKNRMISATFSDHSTFSCGHVKDDPFASEFDVQVFEADGWLDTDRSVDGKEAKATGLVVSERGFRWIVNVDHDTMETTEVFWCDFDRLMRR